MRKVRRVHRVHNVHKVRADRRAARLVHPVHRLRADRQLARPVHPSAPVEQRLFFADYRDVDGLKLPFRIRRAAGTETTEETTFDRFRINAKIETPRSLRRE